MVSSKDGGFTKLQNEVVKIINERKAQEQKMLADLIASLTRTAVPVIVGSILTLLTVNGIKTPESVEEWLNSVLFFVFSFGYYVIARLLEQKFPKFGWLLGNPAKPTYNVDVK